MTTPFKFTSTSYSNGLTGAYTKDNSDVNSTSYIQT